MSCSRRGLEPSFCRMNFGCWIAMNCKPSWWTPWRRRSITGIWFPKWPVVTAVFGTGAASMTMTGLMPRIPVRCDCVRTARGGDRWYWVEG
jgi:hypothetical protein